MLITYLCCGPWRLLSQAVVPKRFIHLVVFRNIDIDLDWWIQGSEIEV